MKVEFKVDKKSFGRYAEEFFLKVRKGLYYVLGFFILLAVFFLFVGIYDSQEAIAYMFFCLIADLFLILIHIGSRNNYVSTAENSFFDRYKEATVTYTIEFKEDCFVFTNNINDDKRTTYNSEVTRVVVTKSAVAIATSGNVFFIPKEKLSEENIEELKIKFGKNRKTKE